MSGSGSSERPSSCPGFSTRTEIERGFWLRPAAGAGAAFGGGLMGVGGGGFRRRVRGVLGCERGTTPEWMFPILWVLVIFTVALVWFRHAYPDRAAALEARLDAWLEPYGPILDLVYRVLVIGGCFVCALVVGIFVWALVCCWLEDRRARGGPRAAGPDGGAAGAAGSAESERSI